MPTHRSVAPKLFGRDTLLQALHSRLDALRSGSGLLMLIGGEAGIGKTALALAVGTRAREAGAVFASGHCYERGIAPPFSPWSELLTSLEASAALPRATLPPPFGTGPPAQTAYQLAHACVVALGQSASHLPLVLLLDDLQWADVESLDLLDFASRQLADAPIMFLATFRTEALLPGTPLHDRLPALRRNRPSEYVQLGPIAREATALLTNAFYGRPSSTELVNALHTRSGGHPLFLVELLRDLEAQCLLDWGDGAGPLSGTNPQPIPTLLRQLILQRVAPLSADAQMMLDVAAVAGELWELTVIERALGWPEPRLLSALEEALTARLIHFTSAERERYRFTHALFREVLYDRQLARPRKQLHARIVTALSTDEADSQPDLEHLTALAYHARAAGEWLQAAEYDLAAGNLARERFALHTALAHYQQALEATAGTRGVAPSQLPIQLHERLGETRMALNQKEAAEASFQQMLTLARAASDRRAEGLALCHLTLLHAWLHRYAEGRVVGEQARAIAEETGDLQLLTLSYRELGNLLLYAGELGEAQQFLERAERAARAAHLAAPLSRCLRLMAGAGIWQGAYDRAHQLITEALTLARDAHNVGDLAGAYWSAGLLAGERGRYEQARQLLQAGLDLAAESGERRYRVRLLNTMGWLFSELGADAEARRWDQQALAEARSSPDEPFTEMERYSLLNLATDELRLGNLAEARALVRAFEPMLDYDDAARFRYLNRSQLLKAELALVGGDLASALRWAEAAAALATAKGLLKNLARSLLLHGRALLGCAQPVEAERLLRDAVERADALGHGSLRWQSRLWLRHALAARRQPTAEADREMLAILDSIVRELGGSPLLEHFRHAPLVRQLRAGVAEGEALPASPAGLTAREIEVLRLIAQGATDRVIADALTISVKTVHAHVGSILSKTGSANRAAAAAFALRHHLG